MYPHQLGLTLLMQLFFKVVGAYNYHAYQTMSVWLVVGIVFLGYRIVGRMTSQYSMRLLYCAFIVNCLPMFFYTGWVYGDVPSVFFAMLTFDLLLCYAQKQSIWCLAGMGLSLVMAFLVRKNSLILLIAFVLVGGVYTIVKKDPKMGAALLLTALCSCLAYSGVYKVYELKSGVPHSKGIPTSSWVAMGMQEHNGNCGWYWDYPKPIYYENDCDWNASNAVYLREIRDRSRIFCDAPSYAWDFYRGKILSQWNEPLYQSLYFGSKYVNDSVRPAPESLVSRINNEYFPKVLWLCDRLQFVLYVGMLCYFLFAVKKDSLILQHLLAVGMIGGFLFSILWEAKARYIFPYYVMMFPCAVIGYEQLVRFGISLVQRIFGRSTAEQSEEAESAA